MDVVELYQSLVAEYSSLVDRFIEKPAVDNSVQLRIAELNLQAEREKNKEKHEAEAKRIRDLKNAAKEKLEAEFSSLTFQEKNRYDYIQRHFSGYEFEGKEYLHDTYERVFEVRRKYLCLGREDESEFAAMNNESEVNQEYAKKFIAVDHVFLILKNLVPPSNSQPNLDKLLDEIKDIQKYFIEENVDESVPREYREAKNRYPKMNQLQAIYNKIHLGETIGRTIVSGNSIIRFYNKHEKKFMTDSLITRQNDSSSIQLLTTPVLPFADEKGKAIFIGDCLKGFNFTFSAVFNDLKNANNKNLYSAVQAVTDGADLPITFITYGQSGSGKSTTALFLLQQLTQGNNFKFSAIQWYLIVDDNNKLQMQKDGKGVLHDIGKCMKTSPPANNKFVYIGEPEDVKNLPFEYEQFDGTATLNSVSEMSNIENFQKKLEKFKFTRSTLMNKESSRSILFFTIYDEHNNPKFSMVDLPGNENLELSDAGGNFVLQQKETKAIIPALSMFKALFLNKQNNHTFEFLKDIQTTTSEQTKGQTVQDILNPGVTFGDLCDDLKLLKPYTMDVLNTEHTKLVLLLTSYGTTIVNEENPALKLGRIISTSKDTFEFAKTLAATIPKTPCAKPLDPRIEITGGKRTRRFWQKLFRSRKRNKNVNSFK